MRIVENTFGAPKSVDRESMIIRGVRLIGRLSKNGREYSDSAMNQLKSFYENVSVNVDHDRKPGTERTMAAGFGVIRNTKLAADGVVGDIHYLAQHPLAEVILERAERMPESFGMSHDAEGKVVRRGDKLIVEDVAAVHSVDIVRDPATTKGLFESQQGEYDMRVMSMREIVEAAPEGTPGLSLLREQMDAGTIAAEAPVEVAPESGAGDQVKAAFRAAVMEAFDDEGLDLAATLARIKEIMKAQEKLKPQPKEEPAPPAEEEAPPEETPESVERRAEMAEAKCLLLESGCKATPEQVRAVANADKADRDSLVESWKLPTKTAERPDGSPPKFSEGGAVDIPSDSKKFAARYR